MLHETAGLLDRARALKEVAAAAPVLWAGGTLNTADDSVNLQVFGVDLNSPLYAPIRQALVAGEFLKPEDRDGVMIGKRLADSLGVEVGKKVNLVLINSDGNPVEGNFTVRGLFSTGVPSYDDSAAFLSLSKAQAFTNIADGVSAIVILLHDQEDAEKVATALQSPGTTTTTWRDLNSVLLEAVKSAMIVYVILDAIVMLIVAVIIANTLLMAVFERIREMGILAALGMKGRQIASMFFIEGVILGVAGILTGITLGSIGIAYLSRVGIPIGDVGAATGSIALGTIMYAHFVPATVISLSVGTLATILLASLYPTWFAVRLEPVEALHSS
jgi:ABC-type lipoprotein release transport system permease subunit